jgi:hypothetical protein
MAEPKKRKKKQDTAAPPAGQLGAQRWLAVRQKSGAGPIEPKPRRGTRSMREREALDDEADDSSGS